MFKSQSCCNQIQVLEDQSENSLKAKFQTQTSAKGFLSRKLSALLPSSSLEHRRRPRSKLPEFKANARATNRNYGKRSNFSSLHPHHHRHHNHHHQRNSCSAFSRAGIIRGRQLRFKNLGWSRHVRYDRDVCTRKQTCVNFLVCLAFCYVHDCSTRFAGAQFS